MKIISCLLFILSILSANAQVPLPVNGVRNPDGRIYAIKGVTIHPSAGKEFKGVVLIKKDLVLAIGENISIPEEAVVFNWEGKHIYPGFIELWSDLGLPETQQTKGKRDYIERNNSGIGDWNMAIHPEVDASIDFKAKDAEIAKFRNAGFSLVASHHANGIMRGSGILTATSDKSVNEATILPKAASYYSFNKGNSVQDYPSSLMGSIALIRQTYKDLTWYKNGGKAEFNNASLDALESLSDKPKLFEANSWRDALRIHEIAKETGNEFIVKGNGNEYQRVDLLKAADLKLVLPLNFPDGWNVMDASEAENLSLDEMLHWEIAPANAAIIFENGISFSLTADGLKSPAEFISKLSLAVKSGLPADEALRAITETPAKWMGIWDKAGSVEAGKLANLLVLSDTLFHKNSMIEGTWVQGEWYPMLSSSITSIEGNYELTVGNEKLQTEISRDGSKYELTIKQEPKDIKAGIERRNDRIDFLIKAEGKFHLNRFNGSIEDYGSNLAIQGKMTDVSGEEQLFSFVRKGTLQDTSKVDSTVYYKSSDYEIRYPFNAFGRSQLPQPENILFKQATVWSCEGDEEPFKGDVLVGNGKIIKVAESIAESDFPKGMAFKTVNAEGKHITPGIVDEHSHIAIERGVNEGTQNNTAEVRIGDVIYPEDPGIYYQLAGGVTSSQLLHGSANPIGGQSAVVKLRWGEGPEAMKNANSPGHIKFALGENVKQSNWGDNKKDRFPQTRMGVEQVFYDAFQRAKEYKLEKEAFLKQKGKLKPGQKAFREDLELEAILEILEKKRFITCHSYVQSEVNMLMHVADSMGFKVNTFTHILEGYKVADKLKAHGANASTFSDWWAYKHEVNDAIPYNAAILTKVGVNTGINSDDTEMGRRLNQEAAKAVLYGGLSEREALKLVTINPARMLHIDGSTGSLKEGKDADLVIWSDNPLSISAKAELTMIDGKRYYDMEEDKLLQSAAQLERSRLIEKVLSEPASAQKGKRPEKKKRHEYHCDDLYNGEFNETEVNQ